MKITNWILVAAAAGCLSFATGCSKSGEITDRNELGVVVEMPELRIACQDVSNPEVQTSLTAAERSLRYGQYEQSVKELEKLAVAPELNEKQKKIVNKVSGQIKALATKAPGK